MALGLTWTVIRAPAEFNSSEITANKEDDVFEDPQVVLLAGLNVGNVAAQ